MVLNLVDVMMVWSVQSACRSSLVFCRIGVACALEAVERVSKTDCLIDAVASPLVQGTQFPGRCEFKVRGPIWFSAPFPPATRAR